MLYCDANHGENKPFLVHHELGVTLVKKLG